MNRVSITSVPLESNGISYFAVAGDKQSVGKTAGEALDALTPQLDAKKGVTFVVVQSGQPDEFFSLDDQRRIADLMTRWRLLRDEGSIIPQSLQDELNSLIEAELRASAARAQAMLDSLAA